MDPSYNTKAAILRLEELAAARIKPDKEGVYQLSVATPAEYEVVMFQEPKSWRLTTCDDNSAEAMFQLQGILCAFDLPPIQAGAQNKNLEKRRIYLRQAMTLTGLSSSTFKEAVTTCAAIFSTIQANFPDQSVNAWQPATYEGHLAIDSHSRYFTIRKHAPNECNLAFLDGVDPDNVLSELRRHDLIHGPDNQVVYLKAIQGPEGGIRYIRTEPSTFKTGDIVEATFAFVVIPIQNERYIMMPQLRVLTLLDGNVQKTIQERDKHGKARILCKTHGQLKRKIPYAIDESEDGIIETQGKIAKMQIDHGHAYASAP